MLLHIRAQLLRLAREHAAQLEEIQEKLKLQSLAGFLLAELGHRFIAGRNLAGLVERRPIVPQRGGLGQGGGGEAGLMAGHGIEQRLQMSGHLVIAARLENTAPRGQSFQQNRRVAAKGSGETSLDALDICGDGRLAEIVLGLLAGLADAQKALIIRDVFLYLGKHRSEQWYLIVKLTVGIVGDQSLAVIRGKSDEFCHADAIIIEGIF